MIGRRVRGDLAKVPASLARPLPIAGETIDDRRQFLGREEEPLEFPLAIRRLEAGDHAARKALSRGLRRCVPVRHVTGRTDREQPAAADPVAEGHEETHRASETTGDGAGVGERRPALRAPRAASTPNRIRTGSVPTTAWTIRDGSMPSRPPTPSRPSGWASSGPMRAVNSARRWPKWSRLARGAKTARSTTGTLAKARPKADGELPLRPGGHGHAVPRAGPPADGPFLGIGPNR